MSHFTTTAPVTINRPQFPRITLPKLDLAPAFAGISRLVGGAFEMALVAPFSPSSKMPQQFFEAVEDGRDPNW